MPGFEPIRAIRVVAEAGALDATSWTELEQGEIAVLRVAPDEAIAVGAIGAEVPDGDAIVVQERGLVVARCDLEAVEGHIEWPLPSERPAAAQGAVAGVPAKLTLHPDGSVELYTWAAYADDLAARLGWPNSEAGAR